MTLQLSPYIQALYQVVNLANDERGYQNAIEQLQRVEGGDLFQFCITNEGFPHESRYVRIKPEVLPEIVASVYFLLQDKNWKAHHVNVSFKGYIDVEQLEDLARSELPNVEPRAGRRAREYCIDTNPTLQINSGSKGIRRCVFYPMQNEGMYEAHPDALRLTDLILEEECFFQVHSGPVSMGMVPTLSMQGSLEMVQRQELRQEVRRIRQFEGERAVLGVSRARLRMIVDRARRGPNKLGK